MPAISEVKALQVLDGRGDPTLEVRVVLDSGAEGRAIVPAGKSKGRHEALELRDGDPARYRGNGVLKAGKNVEELIGPALKGRDPSDQAGVDALLRELDGTGNFGRLGSNAAIGVSLACARAAAAGAGLPLHVSLNREGAYELPLPQVSIIGGGLHADNPLEFQDFLVVPIGADSFSEAVHMAWSVRRAAGARVRDMGHPLLVGDGGGFAPPLRKNHLAVELVLSSIEDAGYRPGEDVVVALDVAANHLREGDGYIVDGSPIPREALVDLFGQWVKRYPIASIEDPFDEDDFAPWQALTSAIGETVQLVGDDLFVTNPGRLASGIEKGMANAVLVKPNQIGTLTETLAVIHQAQTAGYEVVLSIRSGETEDAFIADLAVATGAGQIKLGSLARSSRVAKFNQLLRIESMLGPNAVFHRTMRGSAPGISGSGR